MLLFSVCLSPTYKARPGQTSYNLASLGMDRQLIKGGNANLLRSYSEFFESPEQRGKTPQSGKFLLFELEKSRKAPTYEVLTRSLGTENTVALFILFRTAPACLCEWSIRYHAYCSHESLRASLSLAISAAASPSSCNISALSPSSWLSCLSFAVVAPMQLFVL